MLPTIENHSGQGGKFNSLHFIHRYTIHLTISVSAQFNSVKLSNKTEIAINNIAFETMQISVAL